MNRLAVLAACGSLLFANVSFATKAEDAARYTKTLQSSKITSDKITAAKEIGKLATVNKTYGKEAIPYLFEACKDKDANLRAAAAEALGRAYGDEDGKAVEVLHDMLKNDKSDIARLGAVDGLVAQGQKAKEAIPTLRKIVQDDGKSRLGRAANNAIRALNQR
jgi:HEAT repeat protein